MFPELQEIKELPPEPYFQLTGYIEDGMADVVQQWLGFWSIRDTKELLSVYIDSVGGELYAALRIAESFKLSPNRIRTIAVGKCYSGAALIVAAGDHGERYAYHGADLMIHQVQQISGEGQQSLEEKKEELTYLNRVNETMMEFLATFTGKTVAQIKKDTRKDKFMSPAQAQKYGLIDHVVEWRK